MKLYEQHLNKPKVLYHGSSNQNLKILDPNKGKSNHDTLFNGLVEYIEKFKGEYL